MRFCLCDWCKFSRRIRRTTKNGSHQQKNRAITEIMSRLVCAEDELNYENVVANGSWPTAVEVLEQRLERAKKLKEKHPENY